MGQLSKQKYPGCLVCRFGFELWKTLILMHKITANQIANSSPVIRSKNRLSIGSCLSAEVIFSCGIDIFIPSFHNNWWYEIVPNKFTGLLFTYYYYYVCYYLSAMIFILSVRLDMTAISQRIADFYMFSECESRADRGDAVFRGYCTQALLRWVGTAYCLWCLSSVIDCTMGRYRPKLFAADCHCHNC